MRIVRLFAMFCMAFMALSTAASSADNPIVGTWTAPIPGSQERLSMTFTESEVLFGDEEAEAYRIVPDGDKHLVYVGETPDPGIFELMPDGTATFELPNGVSLQLTKVAAEGSQPAPVSPTPQQAVPSGSSGAGDQVQTPFIPMRASLPQLINAGWTPIGTSAIEGGFTLIMVSGRKFALCVLETDESEAASTALVDCRQLN